MRIRLISLCLLATLLLLTACQGPPPTQIVLVVTATPETTTETTQTGDTNIDAQSADDTQTDEATEEPTATLEPSITPTATTTPTPDPFPTPVEGQIYVAEQRFEDGWMFWVEPVAQIWVLTIEESEDGEETNRIWSVYEDSFAEGEPEIDPEIVPPEGLYQPERGFGKLWRENPEVREAVGWALEPELGHTTRYEYHAGGEVITDEETEELEYEPGPGYHLVESLFGDLFQFNEDDFSWSVEE